MDQPLPSIPPVFTQTPIEPESVKKSSTWLIVAVIIFLLAASSVLAYKYYQLKQQITQIQTIPSPTPLVSPEPSAQAETANWKTYNNNYYSFRIDYPIRFEITEKTEREDYYDTLATLTSPLKESITIRTIHDIDIYQNKKPEEVAQREIMDSGFKYNITATKVGDYFLAITAFDDNPLKKSPTITIAHPNKNLFIVIDIIADLSPVEFDHILSTFKFLELNSPSPSPKVKTLNYLLPSGWKIISDKDNIFSVGFDPTNYDPFPYNSRIDLNSKQCCSSIFLKVLPYDKGSKHNFISKNSNATKTSSTAEQEYLINGKPGLVLYNVDASGENTVGMIAFSQNQALLIESQTSSETFIEQLLSTFQFTN